MKTTNPDINHRQSMYSQRLNKIRTYLLQFIYLATAVSVGFQAWREILMPEGTWDPIYGVTYSVWAAYALLMLLGIRYPYKLLPLMVLQFLYKLIWVVGVYYPLYTSGKPAGEELFLSWRVAILVELIVIPWGHFYTSYIKGFLKKSAIKTQTSG